MNSIFTFFNVILHQNSRPGQVWNVSFILPSIDTIKFVVVAKDAVVENPLFVAVIKMCKSISLFNCAIVVASTEVLVLMLQLECSKIKFMAISEL